ncbi:hypothetical protein CC1G_06062 [Coprinopsis cinerea okayama7|uniref:Uncharacterized protein n=1 Tax=Coprinopsis cinerea (strain Okayama-7 / 130 / ATCC MYA-4618 / FGSC 9003) TaxID=240176 RepID=A8PA00_COPC7|nr:hypothetical protein CC1G_06062 [Coprinopsis cinerea okayama7\|eukprot:XP_001839872.2 hypothetical protein CC1G_06062 [Coprinopsis cinerea okayama7\
MSSRLSPFEAPPSVRSSLLKNVPEMSSIPSLEEIEQLYSELKTLEAAAKKRTEKASKDLRTITDSMRRLKEKEKGKARAVDKVKRERDYTPSLHDDARPTHLPGSKPRMGSHAGASIHSARSSVDPRRSAIDDKKQKKRKYAEVDPGDSDGGHSVQRVRKGSPALSSTPMYSSKASKSIQPTPSTQSKSFYGPDFTVPPAQNLLPTRPPIPSPPVPGPSKPTEVTEDFSKLKPPAQTPISTFYTSVEPYLRPIREEDVGFLEYTGDEVEPFVMPKLGVHYLEVWEEQDATGLPIIPGKGKEAPASTFVAPKPTWDPSTLGDVDLIVEEKGHGPLTERVISALLPIPDPGGWKGVKAAEDAMEGRPGGSGAAAARRERLNVTDLENRIRDTMRYHGLLDNVQPDFSEKVDDPIATALRHAQQELRVVMTTNKLRKERLAAIARDRLGYQEYLEIRDMIDKNITNLYAKLQKKDTPKLSKKKKKPLAGAAAASAAAAEAKAMAAAALEGGGNGGGGGDGTPAPPAPCPAATGMIPDEDNHLLVNDQLRQLVETRKNWVEQVGSVFEEKERASPGRIYGLPKESVFKGIEEEVRMKLRLGDGGVGGMGSLGGGSGMGSSGSGGGDARIANGMHGDPKGKRRADDAMDIG